MLFFLVIEKEDDEFYLSTGINFVSKFCIDLFILKLLNDSLVTCKLVETVDKTYSFLVDFLLVFLIAKTDHFLNFSGF